ncbi:two-component system response regulator [Leifsonia sp. Root227]|uniref:response regulator transcription factor n=1 Tax=Leifsonia sp. Root227 TaxID=1736496 RepID=UPI0006F4EBA7|nr:response regulator transcription factor [Leifsonia sp. Root227]KRC47067.1 two-component system response regulator [Leifsonia sp. Root227]
MDRERQRLLLVEDDQQLGPLIEQVLAETYDVTLVADGDDGLRVGLEGSFDAIVVDRRLPGLDGATIVETLRARRVVTPILMLTALGSLGDRVDGLDAGANDYLVKPFEFDELLARLRAITRTFTGEGPSLPVGEWQFYPESRCIYSPYDGRIQLTVRENALLRLLAENPLRTFTRRQILSEVFESDEQPGTVDTYVHYVRRKTDKDLISTVRGEGYRLGRP